MNNTINKHNYPIHQIIIIITIIMIILMILIIIIIIIMTLITTITPNHDTNDNDNKHNPDPPYRISDIMIITRLFHFEAMCCKRLHMHIYIYIYIYIYIMLLLSLRRNRVVGNVFFFARPTFRLRRAAALALARSMPCHDVHGLCALRRCP